MRLALDDQFRTKFGFKYPFEDIVGEDYFTTLISVIRRKDTVGSSARKDSLCMNTRNNFLDQDVLWYVTGILRDGAFVQQEGVAEMSMQLRSSPNPQQEIWVVPFEFDDKFKALNGLCTVTGPVPAGDLHPQVCFIRINSQVGRLHMGIDSRLSYEDGLILQIRLRGRYPKNI